jgi:tRNA-modifying protein YgfZ
MDLLASEYVALTVGLGMVDFTGRTQLELTGEDRATFLHNFTTNDIRELQPGRGCEAFVLDARGHILGHVLVFCTPHSLVLDTVPGQAEKLASHLNRYIIRERVEITDRSEEWGELLLAGAEIVPLLAEMIESLPANRLDHGQVQLAGNSLWLRRVDLAGPGSFLIAGLCEAVDAASIALAAEGVASCGTEAFESVRLEVGFPWYGRDITDKNLPQEIGRDRLAISLTKGCYLGQETVARIDALGHVNKMLVSVRSSASSVPPAGATLRSYGATVGEVTSAAYSPRHKSSLALAYVRRGHEAVGTKLDSDYGKAEVILPPIA